MPQVLSSIPQQKSPHSLGNKIARMTWEIVYVLLFRPSPRFAHIWRNMLLRLFGGKLHPTARVYPRARCWGPWNLTMAEHSCIGHDVDIYSVEKITIGANSTVSQYSYLCAATHDHQDPDHPLIPKPIVIGKRCWIAADVFVGPGLTIWDGTVVGARSSVFSDLPEWFISTVTPAKAVSKREIKRNEQQISGGLGDCDDWRNDHCS